MKQHIFGWTLGAAIVIAAAGATLQYEVRPGTLVGEVLDPSGAVVPGAKIQISGDQVSETVTTDSTGQFVASGLAPGKYEVSIASSGFATFDNPNVNVEAGTQAVLDPQLNLAVLKQAITVSGSRTPLSPVATEQ